MDICDEILQAHNFLHNNFNLSEFKHYNIEDILKDKRCKIHFLMKTRKLETIVFGCPKTGTTSYYNHIYKEWKVDRMHPNFNTETANLLKLYKNDEINEEKIDSLIQIMSMLSIINILYFQKRKINILITSRKLVDHFYSSLFYCLCNPLFYQGYINKININSSVYNVFINHFNHYFYTIQLFLEIIELFTKSKYANITYTEMDKSNRFDNINSDMCYSKFKNIINNNLFINQRFLDILLSNKNVKRYVELFKKHNINLI